MKFDSFEITKREFIVVIAALLVIIAIAIPVGFHIKQITAETNMKYYSAMKIQNSPREFQYAMRVSGGNALVEGDFKKVTTVTFPELSKEYIYVKKMTEQYTEHITQIPITDSKGSITGYQTQITYSWDSYPSLNEVKEADKIVFEETEFDLNKFDLEAFKERLKLNESTVHPDYISHVRYDGYLYEREHFDTVGDLRFYYYIIPEEFHGTVLAELKDNTLYNAFSENNAVHVNKMTLQQVLEYRKKNENTNLIIFCCVLIIIFLGSAFFFVLQDNDWLHRK